MKAQMPKFDVDETFDFLESFSIQQVQSNEDWEMCRKCN